MNFKSFILVLIVPVVLTGCVGHLVDHTAVKVPAALGNDTTEKDIAVADLDRDGDLDVVVARKQYLSETDGLSIPNNNLNPAVARTPVLLLNDGTGLLQDRTPDQWLANALPSRDVVIADLNGDLAPDILFVNTAGVAPTLYLGNGRGAAWSLVERSELLPNLDLSVDGADVEVLFCAADAGDVDGDGDLDLYFSNYNPNPPTTDVLLINRLDEPAGRFVDETVARLSDLRRSAFGTSVLLRDMNDDGFLDIVKTSTLDSTAPWNDRGAFILYNRDANADGEEDGVFFSGAVDETDFTRLRAPMSYMIEVADLDDDGTLDVYEVDDDNDWITFGQRDGGLVIHDRAASVELVREDLANLTGGVGGNVHTADFDQDGVVDFLGVSPIDVQFEVTTCGAGAQDLALFRNVATEPTFLRNSQGQALLAAANPPNEGRPWEDRAHDFAFADFDGNGKMDMFLALCSGYKMLLNVAR